MIPASWLYRVLGIAAAAAALLWLVQSRDRWRDEARANEKSFRAAQAAHAATVANYRATAERARRDDAANAARVRDGQQRINERTRTDYESRIASARARAERLRVEAAASAARSRAGGNSPVPGLPAASRGASEASREDRFPHSDRALATEQAIQLDELIRWVREQSAVRPTAD